MPGSEELREAWIRFLSRWRWEWFATFTFRDAVHPEAADKRFRVLISKGNRELYGRRWAKHRKGIQWARALEYQRRGVLHYHALLSKVGDLRRLTYMDVWNRLAGFAKIEPVRSEGAVRGYVSKYVIKGGEIDIGGIWVGEEGQLCFPFAAHYSGQVCGPEPDGGAYRSVCPKGGSQRDASLREPRP